MAEFTKQRPYKRSAHRHIPTKEFACIIKRDVGPRAGERWEAHFPCDTEKRTKNASVRYEVYKDKKGTVTSQCVHEGKLRKNICRAYRENVDDYKEMDWYKDNCK